MAADRSPNIIDCQFMEHLFHKLSMRRSRNWLDWAGNWYF